jgi:hypothetical protein
MSYDALVQRLTELRETASPGPHHRGVRTDSIADLVNDDPQWGEEDGKPVGDLIAWFMGERREANAALAASAHEMAACCEALVTMHDAVRRMTPGHVANPETEFAYCDGCKAMSDAESALAELAKALGVEVTA